MKKELTNQNFTGTVLVTGGTGSLGQHVVAQLLALPGCKEVRVFSRDEHKQHLMAQQITDPRCRMILGDIRDRQRLQQVMRGCSHVVHLAAMKHVPACEAHPVEAVNTNILGALHLADAAIEAGISQCLFVSTDKAVSPTNLYGATKLVAEKVLLAANNTPGSRTQFSGIRFGNFFGSRGDVVSLFRKQRETGTFTLTDKRMTRFWIPLPEAASFTIARLMEDHQGKLFVPKMRALKLTDLIQVMGPECTVRETVRRPGEKLHECLISQDEAHLVRDGGAYFVISERGVSTKASDAAPVPEGFSMRSDQAESWWQPGPLAAVLADQDGFAVASE